MKLKKARSVMDKLQWFKFTPTDWIMGKIQRCPEITQARFMRLICLYWNKECVLSYEDAEIEIDKEHLDILIAKKIIKIDNNFLLIEFLNEQLENIAETSQKRRDAVLQRWAKVKQKDTYVSEINTYVLQNDTDKSREELEKEKKRKEKTIDNKKFVDECLISSQWLEVICMQKKISIEKAKEKLKEFEIHLITTGEQKKYLEDFKSHFNNWLNKKEKDKPQNKWLSPI